MMHCHVHCAVDTVLYDRDERVRFWFCISSIIIIILIFISPTRETDTSELKSELNLLDPWALRAPTSSLLLSLS